MPLYIKDPDVDKLVDRYLAASGARNKTEAVRTALLNSIAALEKQETLAERVAKVQRKAAEAGLKPRESDDKPFMDELWGDD
ncbi:MULTISPECIES: type II toxin-antitoxin system VapB family antitoxin [Rhodobacterales]|uniref:Type II toxin-antitoxin system VapB family antitoxin n=3 Tax=Roseobacteraceae TaxID=2854170 RepID=A0A9Q2S1W5_9RHOB|nr:MULTISPECIES: type II toxin-antitoxin system VapB family antitoxin [Rhodobacterales]MBM1222768.1 type II toxin-antitoxin system VapB family antitoxin [Ponticoccus sp. SC6-9]MBM1227392.1 type II toxin-antitoxin system VapB family antitoxin [Ponticoccus sp. SC6-15]MBM1231694.1 type II toxin-antitoxin system VapB family antitoxin [Ponticoccus sp. SC6-38]MBM1236267.1 type II toxin-antitoxin system VapB family antitoxin [Ponticoccus sp. SC6-45]MBM1240717.1 type II toxin-antitoxin system VapB fam